MKILIIGGTGMLSKATQYLINQEHQITLLGRNLNKLKAFNASNSKLALIQEDYQNTAEVLEKIFQTNASFDLAILWIHQTGSLFNEQLMNILLKKNDKVKIYELLSHSKSLNPNLATKNHLKNYPFNYRIIQLGRIKENKTYRWLNHQEISEGVIYALQENLSVHTIGSLG